MAAAVPYYAQIIDERQYTVLVIDDDPVDRDLCKRYLAKQTGYSYRVIEASNGVEARSCIDEVLPDCVLVDRYLGSEDGCELMSELHEDYPYLPIVVLTGEGSGATALSALRNGAADYLVKSSLSTESLHRCINNAIEKKLLSLDLDQQRRELNFSYGLLVQQHEILSHYYHTVTHELKTPLASCREFLQILQDDIAGPITLEQSELLSIAKNNCERMTEFLDDLFESSGIDTDKIQLDLKPCRLNSLVSNAVEDYLKINNKNPLVDAKIDGNRDSLVLVDQPRIQRAITKMLIAARNNILSDKPIQIRVSEESTARQSSVIISYAGINNANNRLVQFSTQRKLKASLQDPTDDNVLGLDVLFCKKVIELHDGYFHFERDENLGGVFTTKLPLAN